MHPDELEIYILCACETRSPDEWSGTVEALGSLLREISCVGSPPDKHMIEAIIELRRKHELEIRKWKDNEGFVALDLQETGKPEYLREFFRKRDFRLKLTHHGRKRLADHIPPPEPLKEKIGF